ncbi:MAG TPA: Hint domain-containing protein [Oligoflexus sp.]|jgi:hypothetical protein|uniref:Hint domain-containing protein n=1 Tax=Oligoflexus sp. TaxID=1971216 RepID=UPI002D7F4335|nr:Hint domain-containing protein [Oligoflexus sp.]HET9237090.1 Hint domain-containing protein [Oligoflexus sp.]
MKYVFSKLLVLLAVVYASNAFAISDKFWGYCKDGKAYHDEALTQPKTDADKICRLPDAFAAGYTDEAAVRCWTLQEEHCQIGGGGVEEVLGDHNVPRGAFFLQTNLDPTLTGGVKQMRCMCGCFTPDVVLDTTSGSKTILELYESANTDPFRLITQAEMFSPEYTVSPWLTRGAFTVGPEEKPVFKFTTDNGESISVTEKHPMVLNVNGEYELRVAREVKEGDLFVAKDGTSRTVVRVESYKLPKENNLVYNINTMGERVLDHVITANGILVGDLYLQNFLNERTQRVENIQILE